MSEGNVALVRTLLSAFDRADYEAALEALDPEIEWQVPPGIAIGQEVYRGRDQVQRLFTRWLGAWDTYRYEAEEILGHGDHVFVGGMQIGRGRGSGVEVRLPTFHVFTLHDGKVTRHRSYRDRTDALEGAGMRGVGMSRENVELVHRAYAAFNRGDLEGMLADAAPEFEYVATGAVPGAGGVYRGPEEFRQFLDRWWGEFDQPHVEAHELIEASDQVLASLTFRGHGKQSGAETNWSLWQLWTLRDGKFVRGQGFTSRKEALEAAGVRE